MVVHEFQGTWLRNLVIDGTGERERGERERRRGRGRKWKGGGGLMDLMYM